MSKKNDNCQLWLYGLYIYGYIVIWIIGKYKRVSSVTSERVYLTAQEKQMRQSENQII